MGLYIKLFNLAEQYQRVRMDMVMNGRVLDYGKRERVKSEIRSRGVPTEP